MLICSFKHQKMKSFPKSRSFASLSSVSRDDDLDSNDPSCAAILRRRRREGGKELKAAAARWCSASTQRSGESRARGSPRTAGWQVAKWLSSALLLLLLLLRRSMEHKRAGYITLLFVRLCIFIFLNFFLIFGLSLSRALGGGGDGVWDHACRQPTHLLGPLVDDHLIYCNITHTRTINKRRRPKWRTKGEKKLDVVAALSSRHYVGIFLSTSAVWNDRSSD